MSPKERRRGPARVDQGEAHPWDTPAGEADREPPEDSDREPSALEQLTPAECGKIGADLLLKQKHKGQLFATGVAHLSYWFDRSGAIGVKHLAMPPGRQTGKYSHI